jgi:hypothetical protein
VAKLPFAAVAIWVVSWVVIASDATKVASSRAWLDADEASDRNSRLRARVEIGRPQDRNLLRERHLSESLFKKILLSADDNPSVILINLMSGMRGLHVPPRKSDIAVSMV